jgi:hypothetical protein
VSLYRVSDADIHTVKTSHYDLALFSSGYEHRSVHVPKLVNKDRIAAVTVLGFREEQGADSRQVNDAFFGDGWTQPDLVSGNDDQAVYELLREHLARVSADEVRILVDYSSMSRVWYAAVLNWARYATQFTRVRIDMTYSVGEHKDPVPPMVISDILSIPGCEGSATPLFRSVALFGLGFDGLASLCVLDRLEPDTVYAYLASPSSFKDYPNQARFNNQELIEKHARDTFGLPLDSVEQAFGQLAEIIAPHRREADITAVPMGPKPHVLAAILLSMRFEEVSCLRVSGRRPIHEPIAAAGHVVCTTVEFRHSRTTLDAVSRPRIA